MRKKKKENEFHEPTCGKLMGGWIFPHKKEKNENVKRMGLNWFQRMFDKNGKRKKDI